MIHVSEQLVKRELCGSGCRQHKTLCFIWVRSCVRETKRNTEIREVKYSTLNKYLLASLSNLLKLVNISYHYFCENKNSSLQPQYLWPHRFFVLDWDEREFRCICNILMRWPDLWSTHSWQPCLINVRKAHRVLKSLFPPLTSPCHE